MLNSRPRGREDAISCTPRSCKMLKNLEHRATPESEAEVSDPESARITESDPESDRFPLPASTPVSLTPVPRFP